MNNLEQILVIVVIAGYLMVRRAAGRPVDPRRSVLIPVLFVVYGAVLVTKAGHPSHADWVWLSLIGAFSLASGVLRGTTIKLYERGGVLWQRYRPSTIALWIATLVVRFGIDAVAVSHDADRAVIKASVLLMFGITLAAESLTVLPRAWTHDTPVAVRTARA